MEKQLVKSINLDNYKYPNINMIKFENDFEMRHVTIPLT